MADVAKYAPIDGVALHPDFKSGLSFVRTKKTVTFAYGFLFAFIAFTVFLAFSPSSNSSSPWFTNIFSSSSSSNSGSDYGSPSTAVFSDESYRSHFSSIYSYFFPNSSQLANNTASPYSSSANIPRSHNTTFAPSVVKNQTHIKGSDDEVLKTNHTAVEATRTAQNQTHQNQVLQDEILNPNKSSSEAITPTAAVNQTANKEQTSSSELNKEQSAVGNQTQVKSLPDKVEVLKPNQSETEASKHPVVSNRSSTSSEELNSEVRKNSGTVEKNIAGKGSIENLTSSLSRKQDNGTFKGAEGKKGNDNFVESLMKCDFFDGNWASDESYPLYRPGSCSLVDEQFNCFLNGRPDNGYLKLKWKPKGCTLPRLNASHMLEMLRGKRLVFVGDSLNRNMWESLVCILRNSVKDKSKVYEASGRHHFRTEASYSFIFQDYKCSVEFFVSPFLVQEWETTGKNGKKKETLRLDLVDGFADKYKTADIIVFNTGHWWTHEKTSTGKDYYQEGSHVYPELHVIEAFRKALTTWARWVDSNINRSKTLVFFRGYSATHFSGGQWNSGGQCDHEIEPIKKEAYLSSYPEKMKVLERVLKGMKSPVPYMNITRLTDFRKDGHPSIYRKQKLSEEEKRSPVMIQDCSHWCLPGVPDTWNEILYAELLRRQRK